MFVRLNKNMPDIFCAVVKLLVCVAMGFIISRTQFTERENYKIQEATVCGCLCKKHDKAMTKRPAGEPILQAVYAQIQICAL
jgi:uncharacterized protein YneF (UPF0154 family)